MSLFIRPSDLSVFSIWFNFDLQVYIWKFCDSLSFSLFVCLKMALTVLLLNDGNSSIELAPPRYSMAICSEESLFMLISQIGEPGEMVKSNQTPM